METSHRIDEQKTKMTAVIPLQQGAKLSKMAPKTDYNFAGTDRLTHRHATACPRATRAKRQKERTGDIITYLASSMVKSP